MVVSSAIGLLSVVRGLEKLLSASKASKDTVILEQCIENLADSLQSLTSSASGFQGPSDPKETPGITIHQPFPGADISQEVLKVLNDQLKQLTSSLQSSLKAELSRKEDSKRLRSKLRWSFKKPLIPSRDYGDISLEIDHYRKGFDEALYAIHACTIRNKDLSDVPL